MATRNINTIYNIMREIVRKNRGAWLTVEQAMQALDNGQLIKFETDFKLYATTQTIHDSLRTFKITNYPFSTTGNGKVTFNSDYMHMLADCYVISGSTLHEVHFVNPEEKVKALNSQLRPVSITAPIAEETGGEGVLNAVGGFNLYPASSYIGCYSYLKRPATPVLDFTLSGPDNRTVTYNSASSTQLEWADNYINSVIAYAMQYIGINMDEVGVIQFSQQIAKQTEA